jgi:hypothetical protein
MQDIQVGILVVIDGQAKSGIGNYWSGYALLAGQMLWGDV